MVVLLLLWRLMLIGMEVPLLGIEPPSEGEAGLLFASVRIHEPWDCELEPGVDWSIAASVRGVVICCCCCCRAVLFELPEAILKEGYSISAFGGPTRSDMAAAWAFLFSLCCISPSFPFREEIPTTSSAPASMASCSLLTNLLPTAPGYALFAFMYDGAADAGRERRAPDGEACSDICTLSCASVF
jgi:hypothetical protein